MSTLASSSLTAQTAPLESGQPQDDARAFRRCLGQFATGIAIITTEFEGQPVGMAVNSFAAVSLEPALVLWSIRKESSSTAAFVQSGKYAVNILEESQTEVSRVFGAGRPDKFEQVRWSYGAHGSPLIEPAIGHFECTIENVVDGGDHYILIGRVQRFARFEGRPLLFTQGQYAVSQNHPSLLQASTDTMPSAQAAPASAMPLLTLLQATNQHLSHLFEEHRQALGVTVSTGRILKCMGDGAISLEALERASYMGQTATEDALSELMQNGLVIAQSGAATPSYILTAAGHIKVEALRQRATEFTTQRLHGLTEEEIAIAKKVLNKLQNR